MLSTVFRQHKISLILAILAAYLASSLVTAPAQDEVNCKFSAPNNCVIGQQRVGQQPNDLRESATRPTNYSDRLPVFCAVKFHASSQPSPPVARAGKVVHLTTTRCIILCDVALHQRSGVQLA